MQTIHFKNTAINYTITGNGPVLVWLHGFLEDLNIWQQQIQFFNNQYTNVCIDLLGHGKTGVVDNVHTPALQAKMVFKVLEALKIEKCSIIGHSMGGYVTLAFAEAFPEKLSKLVLLNSTSYADSEEKIQHRKRALKIVENQKETYARLGVINLFSENSRNSLKVEIDRIIEIAKKTPVNGIKAALLGMIERPARTEILKNFKGEKMIISGKNDPIISWLSSKEEAKLTSSDFFLLSEGHMLYVENVKKLNILIFAFLLSK